ncbi:MAG: hypothetical protein ACE5G2_10735, partial [Candidatus Krumholzibacteriia bacterium]
LLAAGPGHALEPEQLSGTWIGECSTGQEVVWRLDALGGLRVDDRPATYELTGDTLVVHFEPVDDLGPSGSGEIAVYHVLASSPGSGPRRLFIYGFDLGPRGIFLECEEAPLPEDASPPVPRHPSDPPDPYSGPRAEARARSAAAPGSRTSRDPEPD